MDDEKMAGVHKGIPAIFHVCAASRQAERFCDSGKRKGGSGGELEKIVKEEEFF